MPASSWPASTRLCLLGRALHDPFVEPRVLGRDRHLVGHDVEQLLLVGLRAGRQHVARGHDAERRGRGR